MDRYTRESPLVKLLGGSVSFVRRLLFRVLSVGPIPTHMAFILDGNRRYAVKRNIGKGIGYRAGFLTLMSLIKYCYELGVKYVTIYAFSIDNFKRDSEEVQCLMDLMLEKIEWLLKEASLMNHYGVRVYFIGNLELLSKPVRVAAQRAMRATEHNGQTILLICVAYTSMDEMVHAAQETCNEMMTMMIDDDVSLLRGDDDHRVVKLEDVERHMHTGVAPDPDILVRTSGATRLSNFLLWQTSRCLLYSPSVLWPEFGLRQLVWAVLNFQRITPYLENNKVKHI